MFCRFAENNMSALLDGELKGIKKAVVLAHLHSCAACRSKYSYLESISAASSLPLSDLPSQGFEDRVMAKIALAGRPYYAQKKSGRPVFGFRLAAAAAGLLLLIAGGLIFYRPTAARVMLPEATISQQTGVDAFAGENAVNSSAIGFATLANQTGR